MWAIDCLLDESLTLAALRTGRWRRSVVVVETPVTTETIAVAETAQRESVTPPRRVRAAAAYVVLAAVVVLTVLAIRGWRPWQTSDPVSAAGSAAAMGSVKMPVSPQIESEFGIRFTALGVTSDGGMLMLRYQVLDSDKVLSVHDQETAPYVLLSDGTKFDAPGIPGHGHLGKKKAPGTTDYILLANSGGKVKAGMVVTLVVGQFQMPGVRVL